MKLIKPSYEILTEIDGEKILIEIEKAARTCYKSEEKVCIEEYPLYATSARNLIPLIMNKNHQAMLEFGPSITVKFICDRGVSHELVRHRLCSFAQESTRYCNYTKGKFDGEITYIIPEWISDEQIDLVKRMNEKNYTQIDPAVIHWYNSLNESEQAYKLLSKEDWKPEKARSVLPNSLSTTICVKANLREWRHIFTLRTAGAAHPQMRELMIPLLKEFQQKIPLLFDNINKG